MSATCMCAVCPREIVADQGVPYVLGVVRGRICQECSESLELATARWLTKRMRDVAAERARQRRFHAEVRLARIRESAKKRHVEEVRNDIASEQLPVSTRRTMRKRRAA